MEPGGGPSAPTDGSERQHSGQTCASPAAAGYGGKELAALMRRQRPDNGAGRLLECKT